jgi:membrane associated rhomboid family serine protease
MIPLRDDNPTTIIPFITLGLIGSCVMVYLWQIASGPAGFQLLPRSFGVTPAVLFGHRHLSQSLEVIPPALTIYTAMFLHASWPHLLGNMLCLWIFGDNIEEAMGRLRFLLFYFITGTIALVGQASLIADTTQPMIGASGAVFGVMGAYLMLYPFAQVLVFPGFKMPAVAILGFWFIFQIDNSITTETATAWIAHASGFLAGILLTPLFKRREVPLFHGGGEQSGDHTLAK